LAQLLTATAFWFKFKRFSGRKGIVVKNVDAAELHVVVTAVLAACAVVVVVAHRLPFFLYIWLPHWPVFMCKTPHGETALRRGARGINRAGGADKNIANSVLNLVWHGKN
jgi:hypothetical protein